MTPPPADAPAPTVVNVGYRSTNFWVISAGRSRLLVDLGMPGTTGALRAGGASRVHPGHGPVRWMNVGEAG